MVFVLVQPARAIESRAPPVTLTRWQRTPGAAGRDGGGHRHMVTPGDRGDGGGTGGDINLDRLGAGSVVGRR